MFIAKPFKPMLAAPVELDKLIFPCLGSTKLDGIRALAMSGRPMSRSQKLIPNRFVQKWFLENAEALEGMDGELGIGAPTAEDFYRKTVSGVMSEDGEPDFTYYVFDRWDLKGTFTQRRDALARDQFPRIVFVYQKWLENLTELDAYEEECVSAGYEGVILRGPHSPYKQGRSTVKEGYLLKVKRFLDSEAVIIGAIEEMHNGNEATISELGHTKRSSHQANKTGKGSLGAWTVQDKGVEFDIGTGMTAVERLSFWENREALKGSIVKYKYFPIGGKDKPRHPVFLGMRDRRDL